MDDPPETYINDWKLWLCFWDIPDIFVFVDIERYLDPLPELIVWVSVTLFWHFFGARRNKRMAGDSTYVYIRVCLRNTYKRPFLPQAPGRFFPGSTLSMQANVSMMLTLFPIAS